MTETTAKRVERKFVETTITVVSTGRQLEAKGYCFEPYKQTQISYSVVLPENGSRHGRQYSVSLARKNGKLVKVLPCVKLTALNIEALGFDIEPDPSKSASIMVEVSELTHDDFFVERS